MAIESLKVALGIIATLIGLISYLPYITDTVAGRTKPHAFSWLIWAILTAIGFAAQVADKAGPGSWITGITAAACFLIFGLGVKYGERNITRFDWGCLIFSLAAIPIWIATATPVYAVILITIIDTVGFLPTYRKAWHKPSEETLVTWIVSTIKFFISLFALNNYSLVTVLYPASLVLMNGLFVVMVLWRKRILLNTADQ
jgi:hypothetical protein